uniref:Isochorismatase-like domain-containing protein n=1 Tax=Sexangularia sp. CB-2014 TaxID=1486929 RepID=A0A7S1VGS3_9EUKA|mmetsp:Transcript_3403/g.11164  ORF Transcript_3403/g.11164 Transcript_3403/m.11164 type:complete len:202 (+) Transcript_3403:97-702(+)
MPLAPISKTILYICDVQVRLLPSIANKEGLLAALSMATAGARALGLPIIISEQYPKGLGPTHPELLDTSSTPIVFEKTYFSAADPEAPQGQRLSDISQVADRGPDAQILVAGIESHICVRATVTDLLTQGYKVVVLADAVSSRFGSDRSIALSSMQAEGAIISTVESVLYQLARSKGHAAFKPLSALAKGRTSDGWPGTVY